MLNILGGLLLMTASIVALHKSKYALYVLIPTGLSTIFSLMLILTGFFSNSNTWEIVNQEPTQGIFPINYTYFDSNIDDNVYLVIKVGESSEEANEYIYCIPKNNTIFNNGNNNSFEQCSIKPSSDVIIIQTQNVEHPMIETYLERDKPNASTFSLGNKRHKYIIKVKPEQIRYIYFDELNQEQKLIIEQE